MNQIKTYENFPIWIVILTNLVSLTIYAIGAYILYGFGPLYMGAYLLYCIWVESRILTKSCTDCYYYGKLCAFGKGKLCSWLLKKGSPQEFTDKKITWYDILPDFLVSLIPLIAGIVLLILRFSWLLLSLLIILFLLSFIGTGLIRGCLACRYCKQREIGCPAEQLFRK
jgi:hypothetical protein